MQRKAFSLVELSIVLVILGLLVGGILAGQALIRASELRSASTEYQRFSTAIQSFRDKYFSIPGDFKEATRFWQRQVGTADCVTNSAAAVNSTGACDGNGDNIINVGTGAGTASEAYELWRHLALAGLIEGSYTGLGGSGGNYHSIIGTNIPQSKLSPGGWSVQALQNYAGNLYAFAMDYGNAGILGASVTNSLSTGPLLKPEEAWNIDTKLDDGKPGYGKVIGNYWNNLCSVADDGGSANNDLAASYRLDISSVQCALYFRWFL